MNLQDQFKSIIQSLSSNNGEMIQQAQNDYINLVSEFREELAFIHFDLIKPENEQDSIKMLIFLGIYFTILYSEDIAIDENSYEDIQMSLFLLFQDESFNQHQFDIISNVIFKAARYFQSHWPQLPENLCQLINHHNPFIVSSATECLSDCINKGYLDIKPFYDDLIIFIQTHLLEPNEHITITIISILRLFYSLVDLIDQEEQNEIFIPIINLIPNYLQIPHEDSIMINDLFLFARYHQNLFCESFQNYLEVLMKIIEDMSFSYGIRNSAIYCLFSIIPNYSKYLISQSCVLFDFFCSILIDDQAYDAAIYAILLLSDMYGNNEQYGQHLYCFLKQNIPEPVSYISFSISYKRIKENFANTDILNEIFNDFAQGFLSEKSSIRLEAFQSFWPLIEIFYESEDEFDYTDFASLIIRIISDEEEIEVLAIEIKILSKLLKFYSLQIQEILPNIVELLDFLIENCDDKSVLFHVIQCYRYIATSSLIEDNFLLLSKKFSQIFDNQQENSTDENNDDELFFFCMKNLPFFKNYFPVDIFSSMMESLYQVLFNENESESEFFIYEKPSIIKFFLRCIENDAIFDSPEILERIKKIAFDVFDEEPAFDVIQNKNDLDLTECCVIIPKQDENESYVISYKQMSMYRNSLILIIKIFSNYNELIELNYDSLYKLTTDFFESFLKTNLYLYIFQLERLIVQFIQIEEEFVNLVDLTLVKEIVNEYDELELEYLSELVFEFIKFVIYKIEENQNEIVKKIVDFSLHVLTCLSMDSLINDDDDYDENKILNDVKFLKAKINFALVIRESFRYYQKISFELFNDLIFSVINEIQMNNDSNKIIASIVFSDFLHFYPEEGANFFSNFLELFTSYFDSQNLNVKMCSIYGLSVIINPVNCDVESMKNLIDIFIQDVQNEFNNIECSIIVFALLQVFQNYSSEIDVSSYLQQFWELLNGETFQVPYYCNEYLALSLLFFNSKFGDQIPEEKVRDLGIVVQRLMNDDVDECLIVQLEPFLMKLSS